MGQGDHNAEEVFGVWDAGRTHIRPFLQVNVSIVLNVANSWKPVVIAESGSAKRAEKKQ